MPRTRTTIVSVLLLLAVTIGVLLLPGSASAEQGVSIYGFVYDRTGLPVANVTVTLLVDTVPLQTGSNPATTDLQGYYEFPGIQHGIYCLVAEKYPYSASATIRLQTRDLLQNFTLQGSAADLADIPASAATPSPAATPEVVTATPAAPEATPGVSAVPGFDLVLVLSGMFLSALAKRPKK